MKIKNVLFIVVLIVMLIGVVGYFCVVGFASRSEELKTISVFFIVIGTLLIGSSIDRKFFIKEKAKDERNTSIESKAKAKAFDVMGIVFGIVIIIYVLIYNNLLAISLAVVAYLFIYAVYILYLAKYHKEM